MIPRIFHRIWFGGPMPSEFISFGDGWLAHHPGWDLVTWHEENVPPLRNQSLYDDAASIAPQNVGQFRSDLVRYELLHRFGGVYLDTDMECLKSIEPLVAGLEAFAAWETDDIWINQAILGAVPEHPFFERLIAGLSASVELHPGARPNIVSGPQYLTKLWRQDPGGLTVLPQRLIYPYNWNELHRGRESFPDAYCVHHWANRRRRKGQPR